MFSSQLRQSGNASAILVSAWQWRNPPRIQLSAPENSLTCLAHSIMRHLNNMNVPTERTKKYAIVAESRGG
jgi:hypothetical protein